MGPVVYAARLTVVDPKTNAIRVAALASGLVLVPAFHLQIARALRRGDERVAPRPAERLGSAEKALA